MNIGFIGKHGGQDRAGKLEASLKRSLELTRRVRRFDPDITVSFCSPEASRISYGLGIRHVAFCDSPHAEAVMRLCVPLLDKLLIPWIIPKSEFTKFGISGKDIIPYKSIDAALIVKSAKWKKTRQNMERKNILIRIEEEHAAYVHGTKSNVMEIIEKIAEKFVDEKIMVLPRYNSQIEALGKSLPSNVQMLDKVVVGSQLLQDTDVFVGSGGTMTAEAALFGIPTISYNAVPNLVQDYLVRQKLVILQSDPDKIIPIIARLLNSDNSKFRRRAKETLASMEDPLQKLSKIIKTK